MNEDYQILKREDITDRVKITVYIGQPPHPTRTHWVIRVDGYVVWHQTSNLRGQFLDQMELARFIAQKEANWLS